MKKCMLSLSAVLLLAASCVRPDSNYYELIGGDKDIDWIEFVNDSTLRWIGPGPRLLESAYIESDGIIVVETAPLSRGFLYKQQDGTLVGSAPFFEGIWKKSRPHRAKRK